MTLLIGAFTIGLILSLLAMGVMVTFRIFGMADITTDGSITLGGAIAATGIISGWDPFLATGAAFVGGLAAGSVTGIIHTRFKIDSLLSGILVMTALYSINLHIMGRSNIPLMDAHTLASLAGHAGGWVFRAREVGVAGWNVPATDLAILSGTCLCVTAVGVLLYFFFRTRAGTAMRATGDNAQMVVALGGNVDHYKIFGLALANGLVALSGALLAQYQGFADAQMGIGMIVWGLASVIIGEALTGSRSLGLAISGAVIGSVLFRLLVAIALRWGLNPNDLKLITAGFVLAALVLPGFAAKLRRR